MSGDTDGTLRLGYELSELESGGQRAALLAEQHAERISQAHAKHAHEAHEAWHKFHETLGSREFKGAALGLIGGGTLFGAFEGAHKLVEEYAQIYDQSVRFRTSAENI